ncbi:MAG: hypothetical protein LBC68_01945, partial [Prevotellaceae bacterium]|nr:hypothetical protein [Prevotellaceae bacterium]
QKNTKYQVKKFNSKRGLFWYANLTIITSADGSFCIFDKNNTDEHLITIKPDRQTRDKFDVILKNCSLTESKNDSCVFWQYLPFSYQKQTAIDSTTIWFEAYSSPPHSSDFIANSELIMLASIAISMRSKKYTKRTLKITNYRTAAIDIKFRILIV